MQGKGYLVIETPEGPLYTRSGILQIQRDGRVVDVNGRNVAGVDGPIILPSTISELSISISENGTLKSGQTVLGQLKIVDFGDSENRLVADGFNCFRAPQDVMPAPADKASVQQGYRENSNVKAVDEMVNLMMVSRMYETNMNILRKRQDYTRAILTVANG
jgi:flagellar basal body rod protein FlgG